MGTKWDVVGGGGEKGKQNAQKSFIHDSSARAAVLALPLHPNFMVVLEVVLVPLNKSPLMPAVGLMKSLSHVELASGTCWSMLSLL